jgi:hypothetical protein
MSRALQIIQQESLAEAVRPRDLLGKTKPINWERTAQDEWEANLPGGWAQLEMGWTGHWFLTLHSEDKVVNLNGELAGELYSKRWGSELEAAAAVVLQNWIRLKS